MTRTEHAHMMAAWCGLPSLPQDGEDVRGPLPTSNWVIVGKLIAGAYPGSSNREEHMMIVRSLIQCGRSLASIIMSLYNMYRAWLWP